MDNRKLIMDNCELSIDKKCPNYSTTKIGEDITVSHPTVFCDFLHVLIIMGSARGGIRYRFIMISC